MGRGLWVLLACLPWRAFASGPLAFAFPKYQTVSPGSHLAIAGDFNGDGIADILAFSNDSVTLLLGSVDGSYTPRPLSIHLPGQPAAPLFVADVNRDGKLDVFCATLSSGNLDGVLLLGNGDGTFQQPISVGDVLAIGDFNGDGRLDLLVPIPSIPPNYPHGLMLRLGNGDGTFRAPMVAISDMDGIAGKVVVGDFNGDGKLDIVRRYNRSSGSVYLWLGNGEGTFQIGILVGTVGGPGDIASADLNRDGNLDLVTSAPPIGGLGDIRVLLGNGDGKFRLASVLSLPGEAATCHDTPCPPFGGTLALADFDGDGIEDIAYGPSIYLGNANGGFEDPASFGFGAPDVVSDLNGDGRPDFASFLPDGRLAVLLNSSAPTSAPAVIAVAGGDVIAPGSIASAYGADLATGTFTAEGPNLPTGLGNVRVHLVDRQGVDRLAGLFFVSPAQINFLVPADVPIPGYVIVNVENPGSSRIPGARSAIMAALAPELLTLDGTANGFAAATAIRIAQDGTQTALPVVDCRPNIGCAPVPIDLSVGGSVYLSLYGSGFSIAKQALCNGMAVSYVGPQLEIPGLDQINLLLPPKTPSGNFLISCTLDAVAPPAYGDTVYSNRVKILIK